MSLAMHQGTGTLYVALGTGSATNDTIIVPVNASTYTTETNLHEQRVGPVHARR